MFNALTDGTIYLGVANGFRGTEAGARYFSELAEEMEYKAEQRHRNPGGREVSAHFRRRPLLSHLQALQ